MAFTQSDLDNVNSAIASGELTVSHSGRTVTYRSMTDLLAAKKTIEGELAAAVAGRSGGPFRYTFITARGD